ncbi:unnamed protein product [Cylindrotheca closterium]|uniref:Uncharacterized protein n=1 Tax=Cylindrotheca closterium TaxID=2856 RepID=A0AAD2FE11_9STRA|nr:unnamed protein product [Cylindrotheca closterium]
MVPTCADDRARNSIREEENARFEAYQATRDHKTYVEPKDYWTLDELAEYDGFPPAYKKTDAGDNDNDENFYGSGGEYHVIAGLDATRQLAKTIVREETAEEASKPLNIGEETSLAVVWVFTLGNKYEAVGKLKEFDPMLTFSNLTQSTESKGLNYFQPFLEGDSCQALASLERIWSNSLHTRGTIGKGISSNGC